MNSTSQMAQLLGFASALADEHTPDRREGDRAVRLQPEHSGPEGPRCGADHYVVKGGSMSRLLELVDSLLASAS